MKILSFYHSRLPNPAGALTRARASVEQEFATLRAEQPRLLDLALNEAEAIAWVNDFPELVFPALAEEKAQQVLQWHSAQQRVIQSAPVLAFAA